MSHKSVFRIPPWPTHVEVLGLKAALLEGQPAMEAWDVARHMPEDELQALWEVLPYAFFNLQGAGFPMLEMPEAASAFSRTTVANARMIEEGAAVVDLLGEAGLKTLVLKGAALINTVYPHQGTRPMADVDIMVPFPDVAQAVRILGVAGYEPATVVSDDALETRASAQFFNPEGSNIDLHWHALGGHVDERLDRCFWNGAVPHEMAGATTYVLQKAEQLCHVVGHGIRDGKPHLRRFLDVTAILRSTNSDVDWERFAWLSAELEITLAMWDILRYLEEYIQTMVPSEAFVALGQNVPRISERWRHRLLTRLGPESLSAALVRGWGTYRSAQLSSGRSISPLGFPGFMWRYLDSSSSDSNAWSAVRRKLARS